MKVALYLRVSTSEQNTDNQRLELDKVATARGWDIVHVFEDHGISGAKGRDKRPALDRLLTGATRGEYELIAAWSVDRLGRSLSDLVTLLNDLLAQGIGLYLHQQALDTTTPSGRAMFQMIGVFAEFERAMISERVKSGLQRAVTNGKRLGKPPKTTPAERDELFHRTQILKEPVSKVAKEFGLSRATAYRIIQDCRRPEDSDEREPA